MLRLREFAAWITSDGCHLPVYEPVIDKSNSRVTCWLACEEGKNFTVHWRDGGSQIDTAAYITLDGYKVPGRYIYGKGEASRSGLRIGRDTERPFVFARHEDEALGILTDPQVDMKQLGTIVLRIRRISVTEIGKRNPTPQIPSSMQANNQAFDVTIGFGSPVPTSNQVPTISFESYDKEHPGSYVTFIFRYRTREFLELHNLIPVDTAPKGIKEESSWGQPPRSVRGSVAERPRKVSGRRPVINPIKYEDDVMQEVRISTKRKTRRSIGGSMATPSQELVQGPVFGTMKLNGPSGGCVRMAYEDPSHVASQETE
ncbi:hypothetical protein BC834DRAFT_886848 [Gloeopeniophorella convolvens]|nr:hypothetical protein BC834DRAFT_886848 [Gloeopeniophorella convolvens]